MSTANYSSRRISSGAFFHNHHNPLRSASPTRINIVGGTTATAVRSHIFNRRHEVTTPPWRKETCTCSPPTHPGSFFNHHHSPLRSASRARINIVGGTTATAGRSKIFNRRHETTTNPPSRKRMCACTPTTHPGSFRCSLHKKPASHRSPPPSNQLNMRRSAMVNSLVRIGTVEGDMVRRSLTALISPSSHQQKRREGFQPRPSRLSIMSRAVDK